MELVFIYLNVDMEWEKEVIILQEIFTCERNFLSFPHVNMGGQPALGQMD
jgi:hypothetical protein